MLTPVDAANLITRVKRSSGRSYRALAQEADVAASTITRIESGATDPTYSTLHRLLSSCGFELVAIRAPSPRRPHLADLAGAWRPTDHGPPELDWTRWRVLLDELRLHPESMPEAIYTPPTASGDPVVDALLASVAETLADEAGLLRPSWAESCPGLGQPFEPPARRRRDVPPQLAARGLMIDRASLFRDPATVGG